MVLPNHGLSPSASNSSRREVGLPGGQKVKLVSCDVLGLNSKVQFTGRRVQTSEGDFVINNFARR